MEVLYPHCVGLDLHKRSVVAGVCHTDSRGHATFTTQTFDTTAPALLALQTWLTEHHVTHVAMGKRPDPIGSRSTIFSKAVSRPWSSTRRT